MPRSRVTENKVILVNKQIHWQTERDELTNDKCEFFDYLIPAAFKIRCWRIVFGYARPEAFARKNVTTFSEHTKPVRAKTLENVCGRETFARRDPKTFPDAKHAKIGASASGPTPPRRREAKKKAAELTSFCEGRDTCNERYTSDGRLL